MKMSRILAPTLRENPGEAEIPSHRLMLRAGMIRKLAAGVYSLLPLGLRVIQKISTIIREEMNNSGAQEVLLPALLPAELWKETERWDVYGKELFRIKDRHERDFCLGPTHEEIITDLARREIKSYKQLPVNLYQIQTKFRDEIRPRFGLMRGKEFLMKDSYSFDPDEESMKKTYQVMYDAYCRIFSRMDLKYKIAEADSGEIGGNFSQEFIVLADTGEDEILYCEKCSYAALDTSVSQCPHCKTELIKCRGIEVGQIFQLGTKYSEKMNAVYLDENNKTKPLVMGCYGIGVSRTAAAVIEQSHDKDGIIWPEAIAPYIVDIIPANHEDSEQIKAAIDLYDNCKKCGEIVLDDRPERIGVKLKDADLIGFPIKVIVGKSLKEGKIEIKNRKTGETQLVGIDQTVEEIKKHVR
ncbi:MAG: prolyl-tRNA synthetase [Candidatus Saganbacteria bacterium]|uniref:Proline--tRNA ligase n=1 Tax=Candidatus Saganbacteria bacterium TaxID=2575572 RepID=A0A833NWL1_UNCSA|nr:MAG: prolyl-tRNA synthetase [Candidatus Saganbacteria bacterium]